MADAIRSFNFDPPAKAELVDRERDISSRWHVWASNIAKRLEKVTIVTFDTTPPTVTAGGFQQVTASVPGAKAGQFVQASFVPGNAGILVHAECITDGQIIATLHNVTGGNIAPGAGTLRLRIDGD